MSFNWSEIWQHMGGPAIAIAAVLATMGLASLTVFIERMISLHRSRSASRQFAAGVSDKLSHGDVDGVIGIADEHPQSHLARITRTALRAWGDARATIDINGLPPAERTRRHVERYLEEVGSDLRRGMGVLASVGSVAPFVGLLGTVVGIISAFQGIAATGSGGLSSVSAGISEALVETALGLAVAIPAVLGFNYLSGRIAADEARVTHAAGELLDNIEGWEEAGKVDLRRERVA